MSLPNSFWDNMAKRYPRFDDSSMQKDVQFILNWAEDKGVSFADRKILDIGCGTGTVSIPLAQRGACVTAVDISPSMLDILNDDITSLQLQNAVDTVQSDWDHYESPCTFDIALASMTPAIHNESLAQKMLDMTHAIGIYVGWGKYKTNFFVDALLLAHRYVDQPSEGGCVKVVQFLNFLNQRGYSSIHEYFETSWQETYSCEEAKEYAISQLERKELTPDLHKIDSIIHDFMKDGRVIVETKAQKGIVLFSKCQLLNQE